MSFAHGGQVKTDIATIQSEPDPAEKQLLTRGFEMGYRVPLSLQKEFLKYNAIVNLMNVHCNSSPKQIQQNSYSSQRAFRWGYGILLSFKSEFLKYTAVLNLT